MFESYIKKISADLNVSIIYVHLEEDEAHYFPIIDLIVVNQNLSEYNQQKAILHELGHAAKHKGEMSLYNLAFNLHSKMENEAEEFMIEQLILHYLEYTDKDNINWLKFMEDYEIEPKYEFVVKELMTSTYLGSEQFRSFVE